MKYKIGDYVRKENSIVTILDFECIQNFNVYYFSDGTSKEESQFDILSQEESYNYVCNMAIDMLVNRNYKDAIKKLADEMIPWYEEKERIKKESSLIFKLKKLFYKN
jgi:hypothetical protein